ncbi:hypothetical protein [Spirulina sp. 06S082]|uniref:hypothetical protein n=1 Tax=Spirulina sp. 06S082 TaxID=3110248 RepID=UPI002B21B0CC|nr:hypothetical protein [Spirulina sp. 06S082]MEA5468288.1 hypothetical protein [Spirulina sp. 06S082]
MTKSCILKSWNAKIYEVIMAIGVSPVYYPTQPTPPLNLELDNTYFLVKLHDSQVFYQGGFLNEPKFVIFNSSVESSFHPDSTTQSLHKIFFGQKNQPCHLGLGINLTDWLPARPTDWLRITLKYTVCQNKPLQNLVTQLEQTGLLAQVSLLRPDWAVSLKISKIVVQLMSFLLQEGSHQEIFSCIIDLNLQHLKAGYHVVIGSQSNEILPTSLKVDTNGYLTDISGNSLSHLSYATIQVLTLKRRGQEIARDEPWWELLETAKDQILDAEPTNDQERRKLSMYWRSTLTQVRILARKQRGFLLPEIKDIMRVAQVEVDACLTPQRANEAFGMEDFPDDLRDCLDVRTPQELYALVRDYQKALELSQKLLKQYRNPNW